MFSRSNRNHLNRPVVIEDHSIIVCLALNAFLVAAGLILAQTAVVGDVGGHFSSSNQPQMFRSEISTQPASEDESVSAAAGVKPEAQKPMILKPVKPLPEAVKVAPAAPNVPKEKTATMVLSKTGDQSKMDSQPLSRTPERAAAATETVLRTMRGGRHPRYASIVFECSGPIDYDKPRILGDAINFKLKKIVTPLRPYRKYKTFDSWARLETIDADIAVDIGLLPGFIRFSAFLMKDPDRLVINQYDKDAQASTIK